MYMFSEQLLSQLPYIDELLEAHPETSSEVWETCTKMPSIKCLRFPQYNTFRLQNANLHCAQQTFKICDPVVLEAEHRLCNVFDTFPIIYEYRQVGFYHHTVIGYQYATS